MIKVKNIKYSKIIALMIIFSLVAPFSVAASNSLHQDVEDKLWELYNEGYIEVGGFKIGPTTTQPTNSFEAEFRADGKLDYKC